MKSYDQPNNGYFGQFGGMFVPPQLEEVLKDLTKKYHEVKDTEEFKNDLKRIGLLAGMFLAVLIVLSFIL